MAVNLPPEMASDEGKKENTQKVSANLGYVTVNVKHPAGKPGYQTSEFWLVVATLVVNSLVSAGVFTDGEAEVLHTALPQVMSVVLVIGYAVVRAYLKAKG